MLMGQSGMKFLVDYLLRCKTLSLQCHLLTGLQFTCKMSTDCTCVWRLRLYSTCADNRKSTVWHWKKQRRKKSRYCCWFRDRTPDSHHWVVTSKGRLVTRCEQRETTSDSLLGVRGLTSGLSSHQ